MKSHDEVRKQLVEKAESDDIFRNQLLSDPRGTIEKELDLKIPEGLEIQVHEESAETTHLVLPPSPKLNETQLSQVAGGLKSINGEGGFY